MKQSYQIRIMETGEIFPCKEDVCVLEAMKCAGAGSVRQGCFGGGCGICRMKVLSGDYEVVKKMSHLHITREQEHEVLICCIVPMSDLVLTAKI